MAEQTLSDVKKVEGFLDPSFVYKPAPILAEAYKKLEAAFVTAADNDERAALLKLTQDERSGKYVFSAQGESVDPNLVLVANMMLRAIQESYTARYLNNEADRDEKIQDIIEAYMPEQFQTKYQREISVPSGWAPKENDILRRLVSAIDEHNNNWHASQSEKNGEKVIRLQTTSEKDVAVATDVFYQIIEKIEQHRKDDKNKLIPITAAKRLLTKSLPKLSVQKARVKKVDPNRIVNHKYFPVAVVEEDELVSLARDPRARQALEAFRVMNCAAVPVADKSALGVYLPVYADTSGSEQAQKIQESIHVKAYRVLRSLSVLYRQDELQKLNFEAVRDVIDEVGKKNRARSAFSRSSVRSSSLHSVPQVVLRMTDLNGESIIDFSDYLLKHDLGKVLDKFGDQDTLDFEVALVHDGKKAQGFDVRFNVTDGLIDQNQVNVAQYLLGRLRQKWLKGDRINSENMRRFLNRATEKIAVEYSEEGRFGSGISTIFAHVSGKNGLLVSSAPAEKVDDDSVGDICEARIYDKSLGVRLPPELRFTLAPLEKKNGELGFWFNNGAGRQKFVKPTEGQLNYLKQMSDPNLRSVICGGPSGTGKTFWAVRAALDLLEAGQIKSIAYERPLVTVGNHFNPYLKGGVDEKMGPYSAIIDGVFATHLGHGDQEKGMGIFEQLQDAGFIRRYDQLYKRGDTLEDEFLLVDEGQNKDPTEYYHLLTRPADGARVVIAGDFVNQNDLRAGDRESGMADAMEIFGTEEIVREAIRRAQKEGKDVDVSSVSIVTMSSADVKRHAHTAFVAHAYEVHKEFKAQQEKEGARQQAIEKALAEQRGPAGNQPIILSGTDPRMNFKL